MTINHKASPIKKAKKGKLVKGPTINKRALKQSNSDFEKNFKPLFEDMEEWRKESASSQTRVA